MGTLEKNKKNSKNCLTLFDSGDIIKKSPRAINKNNRNQKDFKKKSLKSV